MRETLLLVDANSIIHRAFHAIPPLTSLDGKQAGALYGLASMLIKIFKERPPTYIAAAFDRPEPTFRHKEFNDYKGTRAPTADDLIGQLQKSKELLDKFGITHFEKAGWEADDIVLTLASLFEEMDELQIIILSGDLDVLQAVNGNKVVVEAPIKGISNTKIYNQEAVLERFGIKPEQLADYKGLVGDVSDNIPGVPGIGPKTTKELLNKYTSLENLFEEITEIGMTNLKLREKLLEFRDQATLSKKLATLKTNVPIETDLNSLKVRYVDNIDTIKSYLIDLGFDSLASRIENTQ